VDRSETVSAAAVFCGGADAGSGEEDFLAGFEGFDAAVAAGGAAGDGFDYLYPGGIRQNGRGDPRVGNG